MLRWLWLSLAIIGLDQATKQVAELALVLHQPVQVLPFFDLTLMYNRGAAFSFLSDQGGWQRWFFIGLASLVSLVLVVWMGRLHRSERFIAAALSLIVGGAAGNVIDRIRLGHVVDFIHLHYQQWYWPAFNAADSAITIGVLLLLLDTFLSRNRED